jgi:hypothetical protein
MYNSSFISIRDLFQAEFQINVGERFVRGLCSCFVSSCAGCRVCGACTARAVSRPSTHHGERASNSSWFQLACGRSNQAHARCPGSLHPPSELQLALGPGAGTRPHPKSAARRERVVQHTIQHKQVNGTALLQPRHLWSARGSPRRKQVGRTKQTSCTLQHDNTVSSIDFNRLNSSTLLVNFLPSLSCCSRID